MIDRLFHHRPRRTFQKREPRIVAEFVNSPKDGEVVARARIVTVTPVRGGRRGSNDSRA
jgi:hypothetical protein